MGEDHLGGDVQVELRVRRNFLRSTIDCDRDIEEIQLLLLKDNYQPPRCADQSIN